MQHSRLIACVFLVIATYLVSTTHSRARTSLYPVERSIKDAEDYFQSLAVQETHTYAQAVESYQYRRGRCPPPGFRAFYDRLQQLKGISIEPFWDQIYDDLEPFWGVTAQVTQTAAASLVSLAGFQEKIERLQGFSFRRGEVRANCPREDMTCDDQLGLLRKIAPLLPDIDVAVSVHASPRVLVPWDVMERARQQARQHSLLLSRSAGARTHVHGGVSSAPHSEEEDVVKGWNRGKPQYVICKTCPAEVQTTRRLSSVRFPRHYLPSEKCFLGSRITSQVCCPGRLRSIRIGWRPRHNAGASPGVDIVHPSPHILCNTHTACERRDNSS